MFSFTNDKGHPTSRQHKRSNGIVKFFDQFSSTAKALILMGAIGGAGLSTGLLFDNVRGIPARVEANTVAIIAQDNRHIEIMHLADSVTDVFRDSILAVQGDILRTLRAWLCIEAARRGGNDGAQCGLNQLLPPL